MKSTHQKVLYRGAAEILISLVYIIGEGKKSLVAKSVFLYNEAKIFFIISQPQCSQGTDVQIYHAIHVGF